MKKIALFHPWIKSKGGAEKVVLELLQKSKQKIDVYTWVYDKKNTFEEFKKFDIKVIAPKFMQRISRKYIFRGLFLFVSFFSKIPLEKYDKFLVSTSGVGEFIVFKNYKEGETYAYVHTPLREADENIIKWNLENRPKSFFSKYFYLFSVGIYRVLEKLAWKRLDHVIFNSELSKERAEKRNLVKNKTNQIIYPPVKFPLKIKTEKGNYFLYISRINPSKRQKELVEAFKRFSKKYPEFKLILVGTLENKKYFEEIKNRSEGENIEIKSNLSDKEINELYSKCIAGIFLGYQEDFGIVPLEIISRGKPLLAVDEGGYVNLIKDNPLFYKIKEKHTKEEMVDEIEKSLESFVKSKSKNKGKKIKLGNFIKDMEDILR